MNRKSNAVRAASVGLTIAAALLSARPAAAQDGPAAIVAWGVNHGHQRHVPAPNTGLAAVAAAGGNSAGTSAGRCPEH